MRRYDASENEGRSRRIGRPKGIVLRPEHAQWMRKAVKATAKYYGIRIRDLAVPSTWIVDAMRSGRPMSVAIAQRLFEIIEQPRPDLIGKKAPQGPSMAEVWKMVVSGGFGRSKPTINPATEYLGYRMLAGFVMQRYVAPIPGTVLFVLPGAAQSLAEQIAEFLPLAPMSRQRRRNVVQSLASFLERAEWPLTTDLGEKLVPRLTVVGMLNNVTLAAELQKQYPDDDVLGLLKSLEEAANAERLRSVAREEPRARPKGRRRKVVMPSLR